MTFPSRMNLVAASKRTSTLFVAHEDRVGVLQTPSGYNYSDLEDYSRFTIRPFPDDDSKGHLLPQYVFSTLSPTILNCSHMLLQTCMLEK